MGEAYHNPECGCSFHTGVHWKYADGLWHAKNLELLAIVKDETKSDHDREIAYYAFCQEEALRLGEKLRHMQAEIKETT